MQRTCTRCGCQIPALSRRPDWTVALCRDCDARIAADEVSARQALKGQRWLKGCFGKGKGKGKGKNKDKGKGKNKGKNKDKGEGLEGKGKDKGKGKEESSHEDPILAGDPMSVARSVPGVPGPSEPPHCTDDMSEDMDCASHDPMFWEHCFHAPQ